MTPDEGRGAWAEGRIVRIPSGDVALEAELVSPARARGLALFAPGSGSGRRSPRNRRVARALEDGGLATLLVDLLTPGEEAVDVRTTRLRFDIPLLARRLVGIVDWLAGEPDLAGLPVGLFGSSAGAGAALVTAAYRPEATFAVVSRGGRPDLAGPALARVRAPTLLIVGGDDPEVVALNREAMTHLGGEAHLDVIPGAGHLFEEPGALETVAGLARDWFRRHLDGRRPAGPAGPPPTRAPHDRRARGSGGHLDASRGPG